MYTESIPSAFWVAEITQVGMKASFNITILSKYLSRLH